MERLSLRENKRIELLFEFPLSVLSAYSGQSNLDETWDDLIMPIINKALLGNGWLILESKVDILPETKRHVEKLSYSVVISSTNPIFEPGFIVRDLAREHVESGLRIKVRLIDGSIDTLYTDSYHTDGTDK